MPRPLHPVVEELAKKLVEVRDSAIDQCDITARQLGGELKLRKGPIKDRIDRWKKAGLTKEDVELLIVSCVDTTMFQLLSAIDNEGLKLSYTAEDGKTYDIEQVGRGETYGFYVGEDSIPERFTRTRPPVKP
jgi:hypothetical protein